MSAPPPPEPWERQDDDTPKSWEAFVTYRDLGPERGIPATAEAIGKHESMVQRWSSKHRWVERALAFDRWVDSQMVDKRLEVQLAMAERHAKAAMALQGKALQRLQTLDPKELTGRDALAFLVEAVKMERTARGVPDSVVGVTDGEGGPVQVQGGGEARIDPEAIRRLEAALVARAAQAGQDGG